MENIKDHGSIFGRSEISRITDINYIFYRNLNSPHITLDLLPRPLIRQLGTSIHQCRKHHHVKHLPQALGDDRLRVKDSTMND